jgi:sortase A
MRNRPYFNQYNHSHSQPKNKGIYNLFRRKKINPNVIPREIHSLNYQLSTEALAQTEYKTLLERFENWRDSISGVNELGGKRVMNYVDQIGSILIVLSLFYIGIFGLELFTHNAAQRETLAIAEKQIETDGNGNEQQPSEGSGEVTDPDQENVSSEEKKAKAANIKVIGTMEIPKLKRKVPIVEGTDEKALLRGVGHMTQTALPGQGEQIVLSGHNDTVFRKFNKIKIGDRFIVNMSNGKFTYEIKKTIIVSKDDKTVVRKMGQEVLVVTTCYPFVSNGDAPKRFVAYAYPVKKGTK